MVGSVTIALTGTTKNCLLVVVNPVPLSVTGTAPAWDRAAAVRAVMLNGLLSVHRGTDGRNRKRAEVLLQGRNCNKG